jgi:hypothetical protein
MRKDLWERLHQLHHHGELDDCIAELEGDLRILDDTPFHWILGRDLLRNTDSVASYITDFALRQPYDLKSIYIEMNGFSINTDLWFIDIFGFDVLESLDDPDWLARWASDDFRSEPLRGYEPLQAVYERFFRAREYDEAESIVDYLVPLRLQQMVRAAHQSARGSCSRLRGIPVISTAHGYDVFYVSV